MSGILPFPSGRVLLVTALYLVLPLSAPPAAAAQGDAPIRTDAFQCPSYDCDASNCKRPSCLCFNTSAPDNIPASLVPQFVVFTFNDVVRREFYSAVTTVFTKNRRNPTGRRIAATMFVSDEAGTGNKITTDYCLARKLYEAGHELASHTISHRTPLDWWKTEATVGEWYSQLTGQRDNMTEIADLPKEHIKGTRGPFLQAGGEKQFQAIAANDKFTYDSTLVLQANGAEGGYWPFTLNYGTFGLRSESGILPENCYKGLWEVPLTTLDGLKGARCSFMDFCLKDSKADDIAKTLMMNYRARYTGSRSPLVLNFNMRWFIDNEEAVKGLSQFIDEILNDDDTFVVSIEQLLGYMRRPVPLTSVDDIAELKPLKDGMRKTKSCRTKRGSGGGGGGTFFLDGDTLVIFEVVFLTFTALILIARDGD